jgi:tRNA threonylcarbamoyladenosine biosynthesis protein TsaE
MTLTGPEGFLISIVSSSPGETEALGERIAGGLTAGSIVALEGPLGAGKTCLARGIARRLGVKDEITSPTYTIISEYSGSLPFYHIDAYRLEGEDDFENTGAEDLIYGGGISVIEWSDRIEKILPRGTVRVRLEILPDGRRHITVPETGPLETDESACH